MSYKITLFPNQKVTKGGVVKEYKTLKDLSDTLKCKLGEKLGSGFIRCEAKFGERNDNPDNITPSNLLIIDGDASSDKGNAPAPRRVHITLREKGINHIIFTSHSHNAERNKFRILIPCTEAYTSETLNANVNAICDMLGLYHAKEMYAYSQIWFFPRSENPEKFEKYEFFTGNDWETLNVKESKKTEEAQNGEKTNQSGNYESIDSLCENIRTGKEYHESLRTLSYQYVKDGMSKANAKAILKSFMNCSVDAGSKRWMERFNEIDRLVDGVDRQEEFELERIDTNYSVAQLPRPPGLLGELYDSAYDFLLLQYPEVAMASAIGVVAGICGRKFNMAQPIPAGLNMFITVIAGTGCGKDRINDFASLCIRGSNDVKSYDSFIGPSYFTSPKSIINEFADARSRLCVVSEAGMMMKIKSGNVEGTTAFILDALQCSHSNGYTKSHSYADKEKSMQSIRAMAMSIISESTPEQMYEAYSATGALTSGYLPRQLLLKINRRQTVMNRNVKLDLPDKIRNRLLELLAKCSAVQAEADPKAYMLMFDEGLEDDFHNYFEEYSRLSSEAEGIDPIRQHMATRVAQKAAKLAGIATVFNKTSDNHRSLIVERSEWEWAKALCDYEYMHITSALSGLVGDQAMMNAVVAVYGKMISIIDDTIKDGKCRVSTIQRNRKRIPYSKLKISCKNNSNINKINDKYGKMVLGLDKVLQDMENSGAIKIWKVDPDGGKSPKVIELLPHVNEYMRGFGLG
jgi:hypothetical protein